LPTLRHPNPNRLTDPCVATNLVAQ
jgi:hypothetical protein